MGLLTSMILNVSEDRAVPLPGYRHSALSSPYFGPDFYHTTTTVHTADRLDFLPIYVPKEGLIIDRVGVHVTVGVAAANVRYGLYHPLAATGLPGALIVAGDEADASTSGFKETTVAQTIRRTTGWTHIWGAVVAETATTLRLNGALGGATRLLGSQVGDAAVNYGVSGCYHAHAYAALPATASAVTLAEGDAALSLCFVRLAG